MTSFLTTSNTIAHIERIIDEAHEAIVLISPYVQVPDEIIQRLRSAARRGVRIVFVYGKQKQLKDDQFLALGGIDTLELRFFERLHAKCYFSDAGLVLTSMNLYEASRVNREMGVFVTPDEPLYGQAISEASQILEHAELLPAQQVAKMVQSQMLMQQLVGATASKAREKPQRYRTLRAKPPSPAGGHCIRCRTAVVLDPNKPYCLKCLRSWQRFENPDYEEACCHDCGKEHGTSMNYPVCRSCYPKHRAALR